MEALCIKTCVVDKPYKYKGKTTTRGIITYRFSIHNLPLIVDEKTSFRDLEIYLIIGKNHSGALVTMVERKTKIYVLCRVNSKSEKTVTKAIIN